MEKKTLFAIIISWSALNFLAYYYHVISTSHIEMVFLKAVAFFK